MPGPLQALTGPQTPALCRADHHCSHPALRKLRGGPALPHNVLCTMCRCSPKKKKKKKDPVQRIPSSCGKPSSWSLSVRLASYVGASVNVGVSFTSLLGSPWGPPEPTSPHQLYSIKDTDISWLNRGPIWRQSGFCFARTSEGTKKNLKRLFVETVLQLYYSSCKTSNLEMQMPKCISFLLWSRVSRMVPRSAGWGSRVCPVQEGAASLDLCHKNCQTATLANLTRWKDDVIK